MQENAALRDAIAAAQQQLHEAAAAAASRVLAEKALEGEQHARHALEQAHSLVRAFILIIYDAHQFAFCLCPMPWLLPVPNEAPTHYSCLSTVFVLTAALLMSALLHEEATSALVV